jgi:hypothetical protein
MHFLTTMNRRVEPAHSIRADNLALTYRTPDIREIAQARVRYGYRKIRVLLNRTGCS